VTLKRKYEDSPEGLSNIVENAVEKVLSRRKADVISVSKLSTKMMREFMNDIGIMPLEVSTLYIIYSVSSRKNRFCETFLNSLNSCCNLIVIRGRLPIT